MQQLKQEDISPIELSKVFVVLQFLLALSFLFLLGGMVYQHLRSREITQSYKLKSKSVSEYNPLTVVTFFSEKVFAQGACNCDESCGTCGMSCCSPSEGCHCTESWDCCHRECWGDDCVTVFGGGSNKCDDDGDCCDPYTCSDLGKECGTWDDGCGETINCGDCGAGKICDNGTCKCQYTVCEDGDCVEKEGEEPCPADECDNDDQCTGLCSWYECTDDGYCVLMQQSWEDEPDCPDSECSSDSDCCTPETCSGLGYECGTWGDGCGGTVDCGDCGAGEECCDGVCQECCTVDDCSLGTKICRDGECVYCSAACGSGEVGRCSPPDENPWCTWQNIGNKVYDVCRWDPEDTGYDCKDVDYTCVCWSQEDCDCSSEYDEPTQVCTTSGCCTPETCTSLGKECGIWDDGCGGTIDCGDCGSTEICRDGECASCNSACIADGYDEGYCSSFAIGEGCQEALKTCVYDVQEEGHPCGDETSCWCHREEDCDCGYGSGFPEVCTSSGCCTLETCSSLGVECGTWGDGCGGTVDCGDCGAGEECCDGTCQECCNSLDCDSGEVCCSGTCYPECCPGDSRSCTMSDDCPGTQDCGSDGYWNSCEKTGNCPHRECASGCPDPDCVWVYDNGSDQCSDDCSCGQCSPAGDLKACGTCTVDGCEGRRRCGDDCCWAGCERPTDDYCCGAGEYCPFVGCSSGDCGDIYSCGIDDGCSTNEDCRHDDCDSGNCAVQYDNQVGLADACDEAGDCRHDECVAGFCETQYDDVAGLADECSEDEQCRHCYCDTGNCDAYCDESCNCGEELDICEISYDNEAGIPDECSSISSGCTTGSADECCSPSCPTEEECASGSAECCGQGDGCTETCSDCDVSDGDLSPPENLSPGSTNPDLPKRIRTSQSDVLNSSSLAQTLTWEDGDVGNGCAGSTRTDSYPFRLDKDPESWSGDCSALDLGDECAEPDVSSPSYSFNANIGVTYHWWVHDRNLTCAEYTDCCGEIYTGVDDWSSASEAYVCRPDCRPALCGQNDGCGTNTTLEGFNTFTISEDDDCYSSQNGNPSAPTNLRAGLTDDKAESVASTDDIGDPAILETATDHDVYLYWSIGDVKARDPEDEIALRVWEVGDPVDVNPLSFDWDTEPDIEIIDNVGSLCTAEGQCSYGPLSAKHHNFYAWKAASHNVTCEDSTEADRWIDVSTNVGTAKGEVDTLDPDGCSDNDLCGDDGNRDWSGWTTGYFILNSLPQAERISPTCLSRSGDCWTSRVDNNPENHYNSGYNHPIWEWESIWEQPWDDPLTGFSSYCASDDTPDCEDMVSQNNPLVYEVDIYDEDGWEDIRRAHFTVTAPGEDCSEGTNDNLGWLRIERADYYDECSVGEECENVSIESADFGEWTFLDGTLERIDDNTLRGYFKIRYEAGGAYWFNGGSVNLCAEGDDFHYADDETVWLGKDDWEWEVDMREPMIDSGADDPMGGYEIKDMEKITVKGEEVWVFDIEIQLKDYPLNLAESNLCSDTNSDKLATDTDGDGIVTFSDREENTEEGEYSVLAWYKNDPDDDDDWEWVRLSDDPSDLFYYSVDWEGPEPLCADGGSAESVLVSMRVPADYTSLPDRELQKTRQVRVQVRDVAGNVYDSGEFLELYHGWFQVVNNNVYANCHGADCTSPYSINVAAPDVSKLEAGSFEEEHPYFVAADPATFGGVPIGRNNILDQHKASERVGIDNWRLTPYIFEPLDLSAEMKEADWKDALGFSWERFVTAAQESDRYWNGSESLETGVIYTYDPEEEGVLEDPPAYNLGTSSGVGVLYVPTDLYIGDGTSAGKDSFTSQNSDEKGLLLVVDGDVIIGKDITDLDAFIIANGEIKFELGKTEGGEVVNINGGFISRDRVDVQRYLFRIYRPVFRIFSNPLYTYPGHNLPHIRMENMFWSERK